MNAQQTFTITAEQSKTIMNHRAPGGLFSFGDFQALEVVGMLEGAPTASADDAEAFAVVGWTWEGFASPIHETRTLAAAAVTGAHLSTLSGLKCGVSAWLFPDADACKPLDLMLAPIPEPTPPARRPALIYAAVWFLAALLALTFGQW